MKWRPILGDKWTDILAFVTCGTAFAAIWLIAGAGFLRPGGSYPSVDELDQIGGFLGGIFAPIVLAWAARSFFLQRQQLIDSMKAMTQQAELQAAANAQQSAQLAALERHREEDRYHDEERTAPRFSLRSISNGWSAEKEKMRFVTEITNVGSLAVGYRLRIHSVILVGDEPYLIHAEESAVPFRPQESRQIDIYLSDVPTQIQREGFVCEIEAMRSDQRVTYQKFSSNSLLNYFEPEDFQAVAKDRSIRLASFGKR